MMKRRALLLSFALLASCTSTPGAETPPDTNVPADTAADTAPDMGLAETAQDLVPTDIDWAALPTLPPDKTFTTRYAAGAASRTINPPEPIGVHLGGFGLCMFAPDDCKYSIGIHDDLRVAAAAIADTETGELVIFVGVDALGLFRCDIDPIHAAAPAAFYQRFGIRLDGPRVVIGASHTHGGPDTAGLYGPMLGAEREEEAYIALVRDAILEVALDAVEDLGDATLDRAIGEAPNHDDDVHADEETLHVLRARRPGGDVVFHLARWNAHPTVTGFDNDAITADWVGTFRMRLEAEAGGATVYLNGPVGSVYADEVDDCQEPDAFPEGVQDPDLDPADYGQVACVGYRIADAALAALEAPIPIAETGIVFRHTHFGFHPTNTLMAVLLASSPIPMEIPEDVHDPAALMFTQFSWITVGDLDLLTTPGEAFPHFAAHAQQRLLDAGVETPVVLGLTQDWLGYLMSEEQYFEEELSYYRQLTPGELVEGTYLQALDDLIAAEGAPGR